MATINGNAGDDTLAGSDDPDSIFGQAGDDSIVGGSGDDTLYGGDGGVRTVDRVVFRWDDIPDPDNGGSIDGGADRDGLYQCQ